MHRKSFLHVLLLAVALMAGAAIGPPRIAEAQFIDRIVRPCTAGIVTLANVTVNPLGSGNIVVTTCTGGSLVVNGAAVVPGGVTCTGCVVGTLPYFSAANALADSPITRTNSTTVAVPVLRLGTINSVTGQLVLLNSSGAFSTTIRAGNATANRIYTWPTDFGAAGSVLTDAAGNGGLSWTAPGACATCVTSAAALTSTAIVTGAGGQAAQTPSATSTLSSGGALGIAGSFTPVGQIFAADGSNAAPSYAFSNATNGPNSGLYRTGNSTIGVALAGALQYDLQGSQFRISSTSTVSFGSSGTASPDAGVERSGVGVVSANNGNKGNSSGTLKALAYLTDTNCADSAGAAACGSATAGAFVIDAGTTSTVVSTTSVTANSEIFVTFDASLGTRLSVTCNTTAALPYITARTAATSFTVTVAAGPAVNPACYSYRIIN